MSCEYRLSFNITTNADASELLELLQAFQKQLVEDLEEGEDFYGNPVPNEGDEHNCSVDFIQ